jgi:hypothetical protein
MGLYVYCVIRNPGQDRGFGSIGFDGEEVYTVEYRDFSPVVSRAALREYGVDESDVEIHRRVVQEIMKEQTVLPVAYGMVFKNRKLLLVAMSAGHAAMKKAMEAVDKKLELGIKVLLPKESSFSQVEACRSDFKDSLRPLALDCKELKLFSDRLILNMAFLVDRDRMEEFSRMVGDLVERYSALKIQYSGPWPAYNFVDIHILGKKRRGFR